MPTIDQLDPVIVSSDDDTLPVSQGGTVRRVSRSQLLAGMQAALALTPGLMGRSSPGLGPPEQISVGGSLKLSNGVLSSPAPYSIAALPIAGAVAGQDLVPVWQAGQDHAVSVRSLLSVSGVDVSGQCVKPTLVDPRQLKDWLSDALTVEAFGAVGDGATDDSSAISRAIASGRPVLLGAKTYRVDGQWQIPTATVLIGTSGLTTLRRTMQIGGAWINVTAQSFSALGITFDAGAVAGDSWGVLIGPACKQTFFDNCVFENATGSHLGSGLTLQARAALPNDDTAHTVRNCTFRYNEVHGLWVQAMAGVMIDRCKAYNNGQFGICLDYNDLELKQTVRESSVIGNRCWSNQRGISVGNYNQANTEPPVWGLLNPDAVGVLVTDNLCLNNSSYGIAVAGARIQVDRNQIVIADINKNGSGILCNASASSLSNNSVLGPGQFGIDAGGSADLLITGNVVCDCTMGVNAGGSQRVRILGNRLSGNHRAITIFQVETDGAGSNFGIACEDICVESNEIAIADGSGGVFLFDAPQRVEIASNRFTSTSASVLKDAIWAHTDSVRVCGNSWNGSVSLTLGPEFVGSRQQLSVPEIIDEIALAEAATEVGAIVGLHQLDVSGQLTFIRVLNGGSGYSAASVIVSGAGTAAAAKPYLRDGVVIGVAVTAGGAGYGASTTTAIITGDGQGASAQAFVGLNVIQSRRLRMACAADTVFKQSASFPAQMNWTQSDITVPAGTEIVWTGVPGGWNAVAFSARDHLQPGRDGSVTLQSGAGDIQLRTGASGRLRISSAPEPGGFLTMLGRGSPEGIVAAPPGSDYRNLDGGVGTTLWLKRVGSDASGWFPIA